MLAELEGQQLLVTVQASTVVPVVKAVIAVFPSVGVMILCAGPETRAQAPLPIVGIFPARLVLGEPIQIDCDVEAVAVEGGLITRISRDELVAQTPLIVLYCKIFVPAPSAENVVAGLVEFVNTPLPDNKVQVVAPIELLPCNEVTGELKHIV